MWINPTERDASLGDDRVWLSIQEQHNFVLQQYQPHLDPTQEFDPKENRFRILLRASENTELIIAYDSEFEVICEHWNWIEECLLPKLQELDDLPPQELLQFTILKLSSLSKCNEPECAAPEVVPTDPESVYKNMYPKYSLISSFDCCYWEKILIKGTLFLSEKHCFFHSIPENKSLVIPFEEITMIKKDISYMISSSLNIFTVNDQQYLFSNFADVGETYSLILAVWEYIVYIVLCRIQYEMHELNTESDQQHQEQQDSPTMETIGRLNVPSSSSTIVPRFSFEMTKKNLLHYIENHDFHTFFRIPRTEHIVSKIFCILEGWGNGYMIDVPGEMFVSGNFITFRSASTHSDNICCVIPSISITNIEERLPDKLIVTSKNHMYKFAQIRKEAVILKEIRKLWREWKQNDLQDVSLQRDTRSQQARVSKEKLVFFENFIENLDESQLQQWREYSRKCGLHFNYIKSNELLGLVRDGLPSAFRGHLWQLFSGSKYKQSLSPLEYQAIRKESTSIKTLATEEIERDLNRTFPEHPYYQKNVGIDLLRRVLTTYSFRNPAIGYCQSMNIVVAFQMLFMQEEDAFWMISTIVEDLLPDYYSPSMIGSTADQQVFEALLEEYLPELFEHFRLLEIPIALITIPWLLCVFIGFLSWEVTLRILDCFFYEGRQILFQVGLAIFKIYQARILQVDEATEIIEILKNTSVPCSDLLRIAFNDFGFINLSMIEVMHKRYRALVIKDLQGKLEKRKQTAAMQQTARKNLALKAKRRTSSYEDLNSIPNFKVVSINNVSAPIVQPKPTNRARPPQHLNVRKSNSFFAEIVTPVAKKPPSKIFNDRQHIFSYRSSRRTPIQLSSSFVINDGNDSKFNIN